MSGSTNRQIVLAARPQGEPKESDFRLVETPVPVPGPGQILVRTLYLSILASHVILSIVALPMVLTTFFFSLTGRFAMHRRIARVTLPVWLYVSVTGVVVFVFLVYAY